MLASVETIVSDGVALVKAIENSIIDCKNGWLIWADTLPARTLTAMQSFPQPRTVINAAGKSERYSLSNRVVDACIDDLNSQLDQLSANQPVSEDLRAGFVRVILDLCLLPHANCNEDFVSRFKRDLWELRNLLEMAVTEPDLVVESSESECSDNGDRDLVMGAKTTSACLLTTTDADAHLYRDGNQWCDVQFAVTIGVSAKQIDRARQKGCYGVRLSDRRKADAPNKPFVYRRSELMELSEAIPDEYKAQRE